MTVRRAIVAPGTLDATGELRLEDEPAHHVRDVLRLRAGDPITLCDGAGAVAEATIARIDKKGVFCSVVNVVRVPREGPSITLLQAVGKGDKMETVIRQATELGVTRIVPVSTARTIAEREGKRDRWASIVADALRVSGRAWAPEIEARLTLAEVLARPRAPLSLALDGVAAKRLQDVMRPGSAEALVGPEGGFTDEERAQIEAAGFTRVTLGSATLRTETAGCAIVAILGYGLSS